MAYTIPKLESANYATWSSDIKFILMERGVWSIVNGEIKKPIKDLKSPESLKEAEGYKIKADLALSLLYLNISTEFRKVIDTIECPVEAWNKLKKFYQPDTRATHMSIFSELVDARMKPSEGLSLFGSRLAGIYERMLNVDPNFSSDYVAYQLLRYLPAQYDGVVQIILRWEKEVFVFSKILETLVAEEVRLNLRDKDVTSTGQHIQSSLSRTVARRTFSCFRCHQEGHLYRNCPNSQKTRSESRYASPLDSRSSRRDVTRTEEGGSRSSSRRRDRRSSPVPDKQTRQSKKRWTVKPDKRKSVYFSSFASCCASETNKVTNWVFDSAASHHLCSDKDSFSSFELLGGETLSVAIKDVTCPIEGKGTVKMKYDDRHIILNNVLYAPSLRYNLISGPCIDKGGAGFVGGKGEVKVLKGGQVMFKASLKDNIYVVSFKMAKNKRVSFAAPVGVEDNVSKWHKRFSHIGLPTLVHTSVNNGVRGLPVFKNKTLPDCEPCKLNKFRRVSFKPIHGIRSKAPLDLLYADVWGPNKIRGRRGERFFLSIIDDFSRRVSLYPMNEKSEVSDLVISHINRLENYLGTKVKAFRSDNGSEFVNHKLNSYFSSKGITRELTNTYTPEQNGVCERFNQTVMDGARTILNESGLPESFWPDAMLHFVYTWNRVCHNKLVKTPFELFHDKVPSVRHLKPFGVLAYVGIPRQHRRKLEARAQKGYMVGYAFSTRGYRVWIPESGKILETINVTFNESTFYRDAESGAVLEPESERVNPCTDVQSRGTEMFLSDDDSVTSERESEVQVSPSRPTLKIVDWVRKPVTRPDGSRTDIYYYESGKTARLRSLNEVQNYCTSNHIDFKPELFDFRGSNKLKGVISGHILDDSSVSEDDDEESQGNFANFS